MAIMIFFQQFFPKRLEKFRMAKNCHYTIKVICTEKLSEKIQIGQKWPFQIFPTIFPQKDGYKFGMAKNGCSKIFLTIFPKKNGINFEWQKIAVPNLFQHFFPKRLI